MIAVLAAALVPAATSVAAAPTPTPSACQSYPVGAVAAATLMVSTTTPFEGQTITVSGTNFVTNEAIAIDLSGSPVAHVTTSASGSFSTPVTLPAGVTGTQTISVAGDHSTCPASSITITIQGAGVSATSQGLSHTGVDILTGLAVAIALLIAGVALTGGARRKPAGRHSAD